MMMRNVHPLQDDEQGTQGADDASQVPGIFFPPSLSFFILLINIYNLSTW